MEKMDEDRRIEITSKEEYDKVQKDLLVKGYKWIDGYSEYYNLFEYSDYDFYNMVFVIHDNNKTFEWGFS